MNPDEIKFFYLDALEELGGNPNNREDTPLNLYYGDTTFPREWREKAINAIYRFVVTEIFLYSGPYDHDSTEDSIKFCHEMTGALHQADNGKYKNTIEDKWFYYQAFITYEGIDFYEKHKDNLLDALTKLFEEHNVGFEKGNILKVPE